MGNKPAQIYRLSVSPQKGQKKQNVEEVIIETGLGIDGDAHSHSNRPLSLLPFESFKKLEHPDLVVMPGDFAENITTIGLDYSDVKIGTKMKLGDSIEIEVIQIGKKCHHGCIIRETVGDCIMPREGVFAKVLSGGKLAIGDSIRVVN